MASISSLCPCLRPSHLCTCFRLTPVRPLPPPPHARHLPSPQQLLHTLPPLDLQHPSPPPKFSSNSHPILIVVHASKPITKHSLQWTLSNVAQPGHRITVLAVLPPHSGLRRLCSTVAGECSRGCKTKRSSADENGKRDDDSDHIKQSCLEMLMRLKQQYVEKKVQVNVRVLSMSGKATIVTEAQRLSASWVILDREMKKEEKSCVAQLNCNLAIVYNNQHAKILRLNLKRDVRAEGADFSSGDSSSGLFPGLSFANPPPGFNENVLTSIDQQSFSSSKFDLVIHGNDSINSTPKNLTTTTETGTSFVSTTTTSSRCTILPTVDVCTDPLRAMTLTTSSNSIRHRTNKPGQRSVTSKLFGRASLQLESGRGNENWKGIGPVEEPKALLDIGSDKTGWPDAIQQTLNESSPITGLSSAEPLGLADSVSFGSDLVERAELAVPDENRASSSTSLFTASATAPGTDQESSPVSTAIIKTYKPLITEDDTDHSNGSRARMLSAFSVRSFRKSTQSSLRADSDERNPPFSTARLFSKKSPKKHGQLLITGADTDQNKRSAMSPGTLSSPNSGQSPTSEYGTDETANTTKIRTNRPDVGSSGRSSPAGEFQQPELRNESDVNELEDGNWGRKKASWREESPNEGTVNRPKRSSSKVRRAMLQLVQAPATTTRGGDHDTDSGAPQQLATPAPPPLCSICKHRTPVFGRSAVRFRFEELLEATEGFSEAMFLAEGGFGRVHKGVLPDGQVIAVKQQRRSSSSSSSVRGQGDKEFSAELEVLSFAQHRNLVMLIGYCIESGRRLLVYEFVCNGSLATHLFGEADLHAPLEWTSRHKIAVGAARGMRFLHEDCRVGCIVHRDLRPSNILLTHDFEPLVGDFGLARCQHDGALAEETRVLGTFGYLAPEYVQTGQFTEKADVYSFGVILLELVTGRKAIDFSSPKGQQCLTEWARPLMQNARAVTELIDSRLEDRYSEFEVFCMLHASSLCLRRDPDSRPRMSQVLKVLEGDLLAGGSLMQFNGNPIFRSESMDELMSNYHHRSLPLLGDHNNEMLVPGLPGITTLRPLLLGSSMLNPIFGSHSASESPANSDIVIRKKTGDIVKSPSHQDAGSPGKLTSPSHRLTASLSSLGVDGISFEQEEQQPDPFTAITSYCSPFYIGSGDLSSLVSPSWSGDELSSSGSSRTLRQHKRLSIEALRSKYGIREKSKLSDA